MSKWVAVLMIVLVVVILKRRRDHRTGLLAGLVVVLAMLRLLYPMWGDTPADRYIKKDLQVMTDGLATKLAERHPGARIVILGTAGLPEKDYLAVTYRPTETVLARALTRRGLSVEQVGFPIAPPPSAPVVEWKDEEDVDPAEWELAPRDKPLDPLDLALAGAGPLNRMLRELENRADVVILMLPLDPDMVPEELPLKGDGPHLVLMAPPGWPDLNEAMNTTVLDTALMYRPNISRLTTKRWPKNDAEAFDQRFFLVTPESTGSPASGGSENE